MEWNTNMRAPFVPRPDQSALSFLYNFNYDTFPAAGMEVMKHPAADMMAAAAHMGNEKKKRLSSDQLESLENSFQEEIKLDPDRKMKLARDLGLQPRQVAVWFQNRRARWKAKQLERLYDALKQELDAVSREKQKLEEEVLKLKALLMEQGTLRKLQVSTAGCTEISVEETVESTSAGSKAHGGSPSHHQQPPQNAAAAAAAAECHYSLFSVVDGYNSTVVSPSYWASLPSYP